MFRIKLAGIPIGIYNRYAYVRRLCSGYETAETPAFTVRATNAEILAEQDGGPFAPGYCEGLCLYRKICHQLSRYDAFLMHASAVAVDGEAYVFAAPSGTGKTTHTRLWLEQFRSPGGSGQRGQACFPFCEGQAVRLRHSVARQRGDGQQHHATGAGGLLSGAEPGQQHSPSDQRGSVPPHFSSAADAGRSTGAGPSVASFGAAACRYGVLTCCSATVNRKRRSWPIRP